MKKIIAYIIRTGHKMINKFIVLIPAISLVPSVSAAYIANYTSTDLSNIAIDNAGAAGVEFKSYIAILVIVFIALVIAGWLRKISRNVGGDDYGGGGY